MTTGAFFEVADMHQSYIAKRNRNAPIGGRLQMSQWSYSRKSVTSWGTHEMDAEGTERFAVSCSLLTVRGGTESSLSFKVKQDSQVSD